MQARIRWTHHPAVVLGTALAILLPAFAFVWLRVTTPGDGTQIVYVAPRSGAAPLPLDSLRPDDTGLRPGDELVELPLRGSGEGVPGVAARSNQDHTAASDGAVYRVVREGRVVDVPVRYGPFPLLRALRSNIQIFGFATYILALSLFVYARRPRLEEARLFVLLGSTLFTNVLVFNLGLQASDLSHPAVMALWYIGAVLMAGMVVAATLHFALVFPRCQSHLLRHRATLPIVYGGIVVLYVLFLLFRWPLLSTPSARLLLLTQATAPMQAIYTLMALVVWVVSFRQSRVARERRQILWMLWGTMVGLVPFVLFALVPSALGIGVPVGENFGWLGLFLFAIPTCMTIAILRERLFDVGVIMNRTLVYGLLTVMLALLYFVLVVLMQNIVYITTGQIDAPPLVLVLSTLAIAAVFQPLRKRTQDFIDRRFYRRRYDAARTLAAFSATLRDEVDLQKLSEDVVAVVADTLQPEHVTLWLRSQPNVVSLRAAQVDLPVEGEDNAPPFVADEHLKQRVPQTVSGRT